MNSRTRVKKIISGNVPDQAAFWLGNPHPDTMPILHNYFGTTSMDDWGAQDRLLIQPELWQEYFKPIYRDYCDAAKAYGKHIFMHSDGYITEIIPDLIEIGVDALNSQLFCMDMNEVSKLAKGKITFWGEIDRQHILTSTDPQAGRDAVREICSHFYDTSGGIIAQFEFGLGADPETAYAVFDEWSKIDLEKMRGENYG
jgi:uroporphyrinogen decarboxylase